MSAANGRIAQEIEAYLITMERLCKNIRSASTANFEGTMTANKVQAAKNKLTAVEVALAELHTAMQNACATSADGDVAPRSGGGGGKGG